jgi:sugar-specific transcriptional regulator TrmB
MDKIQELLRKLGLNDHESGIYNTLLMTSPQSATKIAKNCNLPRSSVYTTLSTLIAKGLVGTTYRNNVKQFVAEDYGTLGNILAKERKNVEEKFKVFSLLEKHIATQVRTTVAIPRVVFFEGQEGLKKIYLSMMRQAPQGATLYLLRDEFVWADSWKFIFEEEWHERVKRLKVEKDIHTKILVNNSKEEHSRKRIYASKKALTYKFLPKKHSVSKFAVYILGDTVSILSTEEKNFVGIQITDNHFAKNFQNIFNTLWRSSKSS